MSDPLSILLEDPAVRTARKLLLAPTRQAGVAFRSDLARRTGGLAAFEVSTVAGLARSIVESAEPDRGAGTLGPSTLAVQVACILHGMEEREGRPLIRSSATVARSIAEARSAGLDAEGYGRLVRRDLGRIAVEVYRRLERDLQADGRRDAARLLEDATRLVADVPDAVLPEVILVLDAVELPGTALRFLQTLRGRVPRSYRVGGSVPVAVPPAFLAAARLDWPMLHLEAASPEVRFVEAVGAEAEIRAVVRSIAGRRLPLDQVEIAYPAHQPYLALTREVLASAGIASTWAAGLSATATRPGQAVRAFLRWIVDGLPSSGVLGMIRTGLVRFDGTDPASGRRLAAVLDTVRVGRGADGYRAALPSDAYATLEPLLGLVPSGPLVSPEALARASTSFLERFAPGHSGDEPEQVKDEIRTRLRELGEAPGRAPLRALAGRFAALLDGVFVQARAPRPGAVHVAPLSGAGYSGRAHLVVLGLEQGVFGSSGAEDSLIPDDRRRDQDGVPLLPESTSIRERPRWWLSWAMTRASGSVTLVRSVYDLEHDGELYPSTPWLELGREAADTALERHFFRPTAADDIPGAAGALSEVLVAARHDPSARRHVEILRPAFARGERALENAAGDEWTPWDGAVSVARIPWSNGRAVSPSRLEDLAACPFRYFLRAELGIRAPEKRDDETWMQPVEFGSLVHEAYEEFAREWMADGRPGTPERLRTLLMGRLEDFARRSEPPSAAVEHRVRGDLDAAATIFMHDVEEALREGRVPYRAEFAFGGSRRPSDGSRTEPFVLELEDIPLPVSGIVDRLDRLPDGRLVVIDFKTGSARGFTDGSLGEDGTRLQWALYALAMENLEGVEVERSGYLFASGREVGLSLFMSPPGRDEMARRMREVAALPALGMFPQAAGSGACRFCDFRAVCGDLDLRREQVAAKIEASHDDSGLAHSLERWQKRTRTA